MKFIFPLCLALAVAGCREAAKPILAAREVARVGGASIGADSFQSLLNMRSRGATNRYSTVPAKEALLDELVRREAVFAKARAAGFDQRPDIQDSVKRLVAAKFQEEQMKPQDAFDPTPSEKDIETYYEEHIDNYAVAAKARGAVLNLKISPLATAEKRGEVMARAQSLLDQARGASSQEFARLVAANSEDQASRYRAGDMGWISRDARAADADSAVADALFSLKQPGEFAPLVTTKEGVSIVKLIEARPPGAKPLKEVRESIGYALRKANHEAREQNFYASMKAGLDIQINHPLLESIEPPASTETSAPAMPASVAQF